MDQGTHFMSSLLEEIYWMLHIKNIRTTPYHPQTDGIVEKFNGTLKDVLRKFLSAKVKRIGLNIFPYLLFSYQEVPQESTGFSPFDLLYGRHVRGNLDVLNEDWTRDRSSDVPLATYVIEMWDRLAEMAHLVVKHSADSQQKQYYNNGAKSPSFKVGDQVLVLLPTMTNIIKLRWTGPYKVTRRVSSVDYEVDQDAR